jgi:hypothetical protein
VWRGGRRKVLGFPCYPHPHPSLLAFSTIPFLFLFLSLSLKLLSLLAGTSTLSPLVL